MDDAGDREFLDSYDPERFERPSVAVDVALITARHGRLEALLVRREERPQRGSWALPGVFVGIDEGLEDAAARAISQKAGLSDVFIEQLYTFGAPRRDPRTRVISVSYFSLVPAQRFDALAAGVTMAPISVPWPGEQGGAVVCHDREGSELRLAFDHGAILGVAVQRLRAKLNYAPVGLELLPERFCLRDLRAIHETIIGQPLNKDNFRRQMLQKNWIVATGQYEPDVSHRPAELYTATA